MVPRVPGLGAARSSEIPVSAPAAAAASGLIGSNAYDPRPGEIAAVTALLRSRSTAFPGASPLGDTTSVYTRSRWLSTYVIAHHYRTSSGGRRCPFDGPLHESDNFALLVRGCRVFYKCFSPHCNAIDPCSDSRGALGTLAPWLPDETTWDPERAYSLYWGAVGRAAESAVAEGPGDTDAENNLEGYLPAVIIAHRTPTPGGSPGNGFGHPRIGASRKCLRQCIIFWGPFGGVPKP